MKLYQYNKSTLLIFAFFVSILLMVLRRPDILTNPQFWAEDGTIWYAMAYDKGIIASLILPQNGYYQTISKLIAAFSLNFNLLYAPLIFNTSALLIRALLIVFFLSARFDYINITPRIFISLFIVLMPELAEVHANVTNDHWYLALYLLLVLIANKPQNLFQKIHDSLAVIICGLSGPFIVFMIPIVFAKIFSEKRLKFTKINIIDYLFLIISFVQLLTIMLTSSTTRVDTSLGASFLVLCKILTTKVYLGLWADGRFLSFLWNHNFICVITATLCTFICLFVFFISNFALRSAIFFATLTLGFSLAKPMVSEIYDQWPLLEFSGGRYSIIPTIIWYSTFAYFLNYISKYGLKYLPWCLYITSTICSLFFFNLPPNSNTHWPQQVKNFEKIESGTRYEFNINPPGWKMILIKE